MKKWRWSIVGFVFLALQVASHTAFASLPCSTIIAPEYFLNPASEVETLHSEPILDCADPFIVSATPPSPYTLTVNGQEVVSGGVVTVSPGGTSDIVIEGNPYFDTTSTYLFRHEGDDYVYIDTHAPAITGEHYVTYVSEYFENSIDVALYEEIVAVHFRGDDTSNYFRDAEGTQVLDSHNDVVETRFWEFLDSAETTLATPIPMIRAGTYTMVIKDTALFLTQNTWHQKFKELFIKTAHADDVAPSLTYAITFTINEGTPVVGASSVLFLPGIMGSRLFEESEECSIFGTVDKRERWPSGNDCDIARLSMNTNGESEHAIFTEQDDGVVEDISVVINLYESFLDDLAEWKEDGDIADFRAVPYDWRLSLHDILNAQMNNGRIVSDTSGTYQSGYVYQSLQALASSSPEGKVVLVGHSNGGLVIQALVATMKAHDDPLLASIEKVILIAVPQVGTPESVVGMLHGVEMGPLGAMISHEESRKLMNTSPFAYHLLPSTQYYDTTETPVITFESGTSTDAWITQFGNELDTKEEVAAFMSKESGRETPAWEDVRTPATVYTNLLEYAGSAHALLQDWRPNATTVYEVGGVGIATPATLTYFTDTKCTKAIQTGGSLVACIEYAPQLGYRVKEVIDGDGTVVTPSAMAMSEGNGVERWWVDLKQYGKSNFDRIHRDILEVEDIRDFILDVTSSSTLDSYTYLSISSPDFSNESRLVYQLHSPLDMYIVLHDGAIVGSSSPLLRGVTYHRYGEVQYLSIPEDETGYEVRLSGIAVGSFTLDIEHHQGNTLEEQVTYSAIPSSTSTRVVIAPTDETLLREVAVQIDYEGDGFFETVALPGIGNTTFVSDSPITGTTATHTNGHSGSKTKRGELASAPFGTLVLGNTTYENVSEEILLQLITLLTQYRDLLIKLRV